MNPLKTRNLNKVLMYGNRRRSVNKNDRVKKVKQRYKKDVEDTKDKQFEKRGDNINEFRNEYKAS